jgi:hypothetical protein
MRLYKASTNAPLEATGRRAVRWAGTQAEARAAKKELCERHGLKANGADYAETEVPTSKQELLGWLNQNIKEG